MSNDSHGHARHPRLEELEGMIRDGRIDTLVVALTDMQGRLMGKRVQAQAFLDGVIDHGAHFCTYLLGTDMEMNTPEGFQLMNWETGYGDWIATPVWDTLRVLPWLEKTAIVLSDTIVEETHEEIAVSPRTILKRQVAAATKQGFVIKAGSEFEYYVLRDSWDEMARKGYRPTGAVRHLQRGLPPAPGDEGRAAPSAAPEPDDRGADPDRVQQGRGGTRSARGQHPLRRGPRVRRPERALQARRQGDRLPQRLGDHVHGQAGPHLDRLVGPSPHERLGRGRLDVADARPEVEGGLRDVDDDAPLHGRDDEARPRAGDLLRPERQLVQAVRGRLVGAGQRGLGPRQPDDRLPGRRQRPGACTSSAASPAAT